MSVDETLASLRPDRNLAGALCGKFAFMGCSIAVRIDPDGEDVETCLATARELLISLEKFNEIALSVASEKLLPKYNEDWRIFSQCQDDGSYEDVENPELTPAEFQSAIQLTSVAVIGSMVEFSYCDNGLFAGHSILVESFDSLGFTETGATLFG